MKKTNKFVAVPGGKFSNQYVDKQLRSVMQDAGLRWKYELADLVGMSQQHISALLSKRQKAQDQTIRKIANAIDESAQTFLSRMPESVVAPTTDSGTGWGDVPENDLAIALDEVADNPSYYPGELVDNLLNAIAGKNDAQVFQCIICGSSRKGSHYVSNDGDPCEYQALMGIE